MRLCLCDVAACKCVLGCVCVCVFMTKIVNYVNWPRPTELVIVGVPERLCGGGRKGMKRGCRQCRGE